MSVLFTALQYCGSGIIRCDHVPLYDTMRYDTFNMLKAIVMIFYADVMPKCRCFDTVGWAAGRASGL